MGGVLSRGVCCRIGSACGSLPFASPSVRPDGGKRRRVPCGGLLLRPRPGLLADRAHLPEDRNSPVWGPHPGGGRGRRGVPPAVGNRERGFRGMGVVENDEEMGVPGDRNPCHGGVSRPLPRDFFSSGTTACVGGPRLPCPPRSCTVLYGGAV